MSSRDRLLLTIVVPVVLVAGLWLLLLSPKRDQIRRLDADVAAARTSLSRSSAQLTEYRTAERELRANLRSLAGAGRALPSRAEIPSLLRQLQSTAGRARVQLQVVGQGGDGAPSAAATPPAAPASGAASTSAGIDTIDVNLTFSGRYFEAQRFFSRLERLVRLSGQRVAATGRLVSISSVALASGPRGFPELTATVKASVYALADLRKLVAQATGSGAGAGAAGATATSTGAPVTPAAVTPAVTP